MPASPASRIVLATVVAPCAPVATTCGRSRTLTLRMSPSDAEQLELVVGQPDRRAPVQHRDRRRHRPAVAHDLLDLARHRDVLGYGIPWLMIVDSSATTGAPAASASATSGATLSIGCGAAGLVVIG